MTRPNFSLFALALALTVAAPLQADEVKPKHAGPTPAADKVARADDSMEKLDKAM